MIIYILYDVSISRILNIFPFLSRGIACKHVIFSRKIHQHLVKYIFYYHWISDLVQEVSKKYLIEPK